MVCLGFTYDPQPWVIFLLTKFSNRQEVNLLLEWNSSQYVGNFYHTSADYFIQSSFSHINQYQTSISIHADNLSIQMF